MAKPGGLREPRARGAAAAVRLAFVFALVLCLSSCYVMVQGSRYLALRSRAVSAERALENPETPEATRRLLERAGTIREFAVVELGLRDTKNYKAVVELDADRLATIVSACASDSFDRYLWSYPVVGKLPYKGFFKPEEAEKEAARLKRKGLDVLVRPVDAFSTLGWFADPLFSFMAEYDEAELAETIIHEMVHATVFVKQAKDFNEEFATFVGRQGALAYLESARGPDGEVTEKALRSREDSRAFAAYLRNTARALAKIYSSGASREEKLRLKAEVVRSRAKEYEGLPEGTFHNAAYRSFPMDRINNAFLDLYRLYEGEDELYLDFLSRVCHGNLSEFVRTVAGISDRKGDPKESMRALLASGR